LYRGLALKRLGKQDEAVDALHQAVRCKPEWVDAHLRLGQMLVQEGKKEEGIVELRRAAAVAPAEDARPREALARALGREGQLK
jgi:tetratricopeptide (TPR) repeat protein